MLGCLQNEIKLTVMDAFVYYNKLLKVSYLIPSDMLVLVCITSSLIRDDFL